MDFQPLFTQLLAILVVFFAAFITYLIMKPFLFKRMRFTDVKICPKCGSTDVKTITSANKQVGVIMGGSPELHRCMKCKFEGAFPVVHEDDVKAFQDIIKEEQKELRAAKKNASKKKSTRKKSTKKKN